jgi:hypothetical protein
MMLGNQNDLATIVCRQSMEQRVSRSTAGAAGRSFVMVECKRVDIV